MNEINRMLLNCEVDLDAGKCWYIYIIKKIKIDSLFTVSCIHKHKAHRPITAVFSAFIKIKNIIK